MRQSCIAACIQQFRLIKASAFSPISDPPKSDGLAFVFCYLSLHPMARRLFHFLLSARARHCRDLNRSADSTIKPTTVKTTRTSKQTTLINKTKQNKHNTAKQQHNTKQHNNTKRQDKPNKQTHKQAKQSNAQKTNQQTKIEQSKRTQHTTNKQNRPNKTKEHSTLQNKKQYKTQHTNKQAHINQQPTTTTTITTATTKTTGNQVPLRINHVNQLFEPKGQGKIAGKKRDSEGEKKEASKQKE